MVNVWARPRTVHSGTVHRATISFRATKFPMWRRTMSGLRASLQERNEFRREGQWRDAGVTAGDISFSKLSGMDARDIKVFREFSARGWMFIVRCPKVAARAMHGIFPPKIM